MQLLRGALLTTTLSATLLAGLAGALAATAAFAQSAPMVVIVVRHAEKGTTPANDPPLTEAGIARAKALAAALGAANVQAVITTQLARTRETGRPTAEARGLTMETVQVGGAAAEHAKAVADAVRKHVGQTVLVVGHSNTVTQIIAALGGPKMPDLCDSQYSNIYTLVLEGTSARLVQATFGAPSPEMATGCPAMK